MPWIRLEHMCFFYSLKFPLIDIWLLSYVDTKNSWLERVVDKVANKNRPPFCDNYVVVSYGIFFGWIVALFQECGRQNDTSVA